MKDKSQAMQAADGTDFRDHDPGAENRKADHIELAFKSRVEVSALDRRFYYEPMLNGHPTKNSLVPVGFNGKSLRLPIWVSSMTGGTAMARTINHNLAQACREFGMGMGLGSCRSLLSSDDMFSDFNVRHIIGPDLPLYGNLGIAQVEQLFDSGRENLLKALVDKLQADGLIIHVNPMQEWLQPEGDRYLKPPLETIKRVLDIGTIPLIVKEVGQGFGPQSMKELLELPLVAVEFAASGGTNFALLELLRNTETSRDSYKGLTHLGHDAEEMLHFANEIVQNHKVKTGHLIISGGIDGFLDGFYMLQKSKMPALYGQASKFLTYARKDYDTLREFIQMQKSGLELAYAMLRTR